MSALPLEAPASKSMTQRALVIAALATGPSRVQAPLDCDDARHLTALLEALGVGARWITQPVERGMEARVEVTPAPLRAPATTIFCGNAGTTVRFGAALAALTEGTLRLDGDRHMRRRPMGPLAGALGAIGVEIRYEGAPERLPIALRRGAVPRPVAVVDGSLSSQFASGLMLVAPRLPAGLTVVLDGAIVSRPYLEMTAAMMRRAGATVEPTGRGYRVEPGGYRGGDFTIEPDWSAAAFLLGAGHLAGVALDRATLPAASLQGDAAFAEMMDRLAVPPPGGRFVFDLTDTPDLIAPLTAICLFASHPTAIRGAAHTRVKESDRVAVLAGELAKIGARIEAHPDGLDITPLGRARSATLDPHGDHRMAMAFALVGLRVPLTIGDRGCVSKSFPGFWDAIARIEGAA